MIKKITLNPVQSILNQEYKTQSLNFDLLQTNIEGLIKLHQKMHKDTWILCCGMPGTGKSNLILWLWQQINAIQEKPCVLKQDVVETYEDLIVFLKKHFDVHGKTGIVDEGAFFANSRNSMAKDSKDLNEVMDIIRIMQKRILIASSKPWKIDLSVRERADVFIRTYYNIHEDEYQFGYYSNAKANSVLGNKLAMAVFADPVKLFKICPPDFYGTVPKIEDELDKEYQGYKHRFGSDFLDNKLEALEERKQKKGKKPFDIDINDPSLFELTPEFQKDLLTVDKPNRKERYRKPYTGMKRIKC